MQLIEIILMNNQLLYFDANHVCRYGECSHLKCLRSIHAIKLIWSKILYVIMQREKTLLNFIVILQKWFFVTLSNMVHFKFGFNQFSIFYVIESLHKK